MQIDILFIVLALAMFSERKTAIKQIGGADPSMVGLLFVVVTGGGFAVAYALNDNVKEWVDKLFDDDIVVSELDCSKHDKKDTCPSPKCVFKDGSCKKSVGTPTQSDPTLIENPPPINNCSSSPAVKIYNRITGAPRGKNTCNNGTPKFIFDMGTGRGETYHIKCNKGVNTITAIKSNKKLIINSFNINRAVNNFMCTDKVSGNKFAPDGTRNYISYNEGAFYNWEIIPGSIKNTTWYAVVQYCMGGGIKMPKSGDVFSSLAKSSATLTSVNDFNLTVSSNKGTDPAFSQFKFTPIDPLPKNTKYLLTNTLYAVSIRRGFQLRPSPTLVSKNKSRQHTNIVAVSDGVRVGNKIVEDSKFYILFKTDTNNRNAEPIKKGQTLHVYHNTQDSASGTRDALHGEMKVLETQRVCSIKESGHNNVYDSNWQLVAHFDTKLGNTGQKYEKFTSKIVHCLPTNAGSTPNIGCEI
jgi:hypothetical protein